MFKNNALANDPNVTATTVIWKTGWPANQKAYTEKQAL